MVVLQEGPTTFAIHTMARDRPFVFKCPSESERDQWVSAIMTQVQRYVPCPFAARPSLGPSVLGFTLPPFLLCRSQRVSGEVSRDSAYSVSDQQVRALPSCTV